MANPKRLWTDYPPHYAALAKSIAIATLPVHHGPFSSKSEALHFRAAFYRFREALRCSITRDDGSYPARLHDILETLSVSVERRPDNMKQYNAIFDLDPVVREAERQDPASAQIRQLAVANFVASQTPKETATPISEPIFSDEEMTNRLASIKG